MFLVSKNTLQSENVDFDLFYSNTHLMFSFVIFGCVKSLKCNQEVRYLFVGCSEISVSVIVKHVQQKLLWLFVCMRGLVKFFSAWETEIKLGCGLLEVDQ